MDYDKIGNKVLRKGRFLCTKNHSCPESKISFVYKYLSLRKLRWKEAFSLLR